MDLIGVVDTMFARYDMGGEALDELSECPGYGTQFTTLRRTVPGFKDLAVAAKKMIEEDGCRIVVALGMPGREQVDKVCAHEASTGIMTAQLMTNTPILEVFVHEDESDDPAELAMVFKNRSRDHARNAYLMLYEPEQLTARAGQGVRQGFANAGPLELVALELSGPNESAPRPDSRPRLRGVPRHRERRPVGAQTARRGQRRPVVRHGDLVGVEGRQRPLVPAESITTSPRVDLPEVGQRHLAAEQQRARRRRLGDRPRPRSGRSRCRSAWSRRSSRPWRP